MKSVAIRMGALTALLASLVLAASSIGAGHANELDKSFGTKGFTTVRAVGGPVPHALVKDRHGRILAAIGGISDLYGFALYRYLPSGKLDRSFGEDGIVEPLFPGLYAAAEDTVVQDSGRIVVGGWRGTNRSGGRVLLGYKPNGKLDPTFGKDGRVQPALKRGGIRIRGLARAPGGGMIAVGGEREGGKEGPHPAAVVLKYGPNGRLARGFGRGGKAKVGVRSRRFAYTGFDDVKVLGSGKILVAGYRQGRLIAARFTAAGLLDRDFGVGGIREMGLPRNDRCQFPFCRPEASVASTTSGWIVVQGELRAARIQVAVLDRAGDFVTHFAGTGRKQLGVGVTASASDVVVRPDGRILLTGVRSRDGQRKNLRAAVIQLRPNGKLDRGFGAGGVFTFRPRFEGWAGAAMVTRAGDVLVGAGTRTPRKRQGYRYWINLLKLK